MLQLTQKLREYNNPIVPVSIIWHRIKTAKGWKLFLKEGDFVFIENLKLCNCHDAPTHIITACWQTLDEKQKHISCMDLVSKDLVKIVL